MKKFTLLCTIACMLFAVTTMAQSADSKVTVNTYPNPVVTIVNLEPSIPGPFSIQVCDMIGKPLRTFESRTGKGFVNMTGLAPGVYNFKFIFANAKICPITKQIVKGTASKQ